MRIGILGAGSWGTTLAILLTEKSHRVTLWSYLEKDAELIRITRENPPFLPGIWVPESITITSELEKSVDGAEIIVCAVPSQYLRSVVTRLKGRSWDKTIVVNVAKGIENGSLMTMSEMLHDAIPGLPEGSVATLSGPSHAEEVSRKIPTTVVAASKDPATARRVQDAFMLPYFRVYQSDDVRGV